MPKTSKGALRTLVIDISVDKATQSPLQREKGQISRSISCGL